MRLDVPQQPLDRHKCCHRRNDQTHDQQTPGLMEPGVVQTLRKLQTAGGNQCWDTQNERKLCGGSAAGSQGQSQQDRRAAAAGSRKDQYKKAMNEQGNYQTSAQKKDGKTDEQREMVERYRRYSDETAENVDFEEIDGPISEDQPLNDNDHSSATSYQEEPVSDAEFEEI